MVQAQIAHKTPMAVQPMLGLVAWRVKQSKYKRLASKALMARAFVWLSINMTIGSSFDVTRNRKKDKTFFSC